MFLEIFRQCCTVRRFGVSAAAALLLLVPALSSHATTLHGDFSGSAFAFEAVQETTISGGDPEPLFDAPNVVGDSLIFSPTVFSATSSGGGIDSDHSELDLFIQATGVGTTIETIILSEGGDSVISTAGALTGTAISIGGVITVTETLSGVLAVPVIITFADFAGNFAPTYSPGSFIATAGTVPWTGGFIFDLAAIVPDATRAQFTLNNILTASSEGGTSASISKNSLVLTVVPEPTTGALLGIGLAVIATLSRKND